MGQFPVSLSHHPLMAAHMVNKTQVVRISVVCDVCTNHSALNMTVAAAGNPHTYIPSSKAPHLRLLLNDRQHYGNI